MTGTAGLSPEKIRDIQYMEEISLNAWPSRKIELYDGWLIRYSRNYTYRTNAVEQVAPSTLPIEEKVAYCEDVYRSYHTPCHFKINPLIDPSFDRFLSARDYAIRHVTEVMTADLGRTHLMKSLSSEYEFENRLGLPSCVHYDGDINVLVSSDVTDEWINGLFHLNGTTDPQLRRIVPAMYYAIPKKTIAASIEIDVHMVASGLGICDREYIGVYAVYVSAGCRRRNYARAICSTLLSLGREQGAEAAYLQVVKGNIHAKSLYADLGFQDFYTYWFRSLDI